MILYELGIISIDCKHIKAKILYKIIKGGE